MTNHNGEPVSDGNGGQRPSFASLWTPNHCRATLQTFCKKMTIQQARTRPPWQMWFLPIPFLALGTWLTWVMATELYLERQSKSWPRVSGALHIEVGEYRKELSYQYRVDGVDYSSSRVTFGEIGNRTRSEEWEEVGRRPDGSAVEVFYMPDDPKESTLVAGLCEGTYSTLLLGFGFLLAGAFGALFPLILWKKIAEQVVTHQPA